MATSIATNTAARLRSTESLAVQSAMPPSTLVATKAPSAMNTPWPKFSTSIRPKISVSPEAMMKMISPIASPATLSVTQVDGRADQRPGQQQQREQQRDRLPVELGLQLQHAARGRAAGGGGGGGGVHWCAPSDRPSRRCCSRSSSASSAIAPRCTTRPLSITATWSPSALAIWKFCSTSRMVVFCAFSWRKASIRLTMIDGARPLLGSSISGS